MRFFRQTWLVAVREWSDAIRSRRALVVLLLYLAASISCMNGAITIIGKIETQLSEALALPQSEKTGVVSEAVWQSKKFQKTMRSVARDELILQDITGRHPVELLHAWFSFLFAPALVVLACSGRVSEELGNGSARYELFRATRAEWTLGKWTGMALMIGVSLALGALAAWIVAEIRSCAMASMLPALLEWSAKAWVYSLAWLGFAEGLSLLTRSPGKATAFGILAVGAFSVFALLAALSEKHEKIPEFFRHVELFTPYAWKDGLWRNAAAPFFTSSFALVSLGLCGLSAGYAFFRRRDV